MLTVEITSYGIQIKVYPEGCVAYPGYTLSILTSIYVFALGLDEDKCNSNLLDIYTWQEGLLTYGHYTVRYDTITQCLMHAIKLSRSYVIC